MAWTRSVRWTVGLALAGVLVLAGCGDDEANGDARNAGDDTAATAVTRAPADSAAGDGAAGSANGAGAADARGAAGATGARRGDDTSAAGGAAAGQTVRYTAQVGAFVVEANADALERRLDQLGLPVWRTVATVNGRRVHRVRVGATTDAAEARRLRALLRDRHLPVWLAPLVGSDARARVPDGALAATRELLRTS